MRRSMMNTMTDAVQAGVAAALTLGADAAKARYGQSESIGCDFESGRLKTTGTEQTVGFSLEVVAGGKRATVMGTDPSDIAGLAERAMALARVGAAAHFDRYPSPTDCVRVDRHSPATADVSRDTLIGACQEIVDALKSYDPELFIEASAGRSESESVMATSSGLVHQTRLTRWRLGAFAQRTDGTDMLFCGRGRDWCLMNDFFDPAYISARTIEDLRRGAVMTVSPTGACTVVLPPEAVGMFLYPIIMGINGRSVAKGESPLRGKVGEAIADAALTIVDRPHVAWAPSSAEIDDNGVPTRETPIITKGVLQGFLYDLDTAGLAGTTPTGHAGCSPYRMQIEPGAQTSTEILAGLDDALIVKEIMGFGQTNLMNGDIAGNVSLGFRARKGEIQGRVKNTMVAGNLYEMLKNGVRVSSDTDPVSGLPWLVLEGANVSAG